MLPVDKLYAAFQDAGVPVEKLEAACESVGTKWVLVIELHHVLHFDKDGNYIT